MRWAASIGEEVGGNTQAREMLLGKGVSVILKSINVKFRVGNGLLFAVHHSH